MASRLPAFPRFVFTVFEPISLFAGFLPAMFKPDWFISAQNVSPSPFISTDNSRLVAQQLGNCYGLLALIGLAVLNTSTELPVVRNYLKALWVADITHVAATCYAIGYGRSVSVGDWDAMLWGNVGVTAFLFLTRTAYLLGLFGADALPSYPATTKTTKKLH